MAYAGAPKTLQGAISCHVGIECVAVVPACAAPPSSLFAERCRRDRLRSSVVAAVFTAPRSLAAQRCQL
eukprot:1184189-Pleurochrysis_carterae.AAC.1